MFVLHKTYPGLIPGTSYCLHSTASNDLSAESDVTGKHHQVWEPPSQKNSPNIPKITVQQTSRLEL